MTASIADRLPDIENEHYIYKISLTASGDKLTAQLPAAKDFLSFPIIAHCVPGSGSTIKAQYSLDDADTPADDTYITTSEDSITVNKAVVFDFYVRRLRVEQTAGSGTSTIYVVSPVTLNWA